MTIYRANVSITNSVVVGPAVNTWHLRTDGVDDDGDNLIDDLMTALSEYYAAVKNEHASGTVFAFDGIVTQVGVEDPIIRVKDPWTVSSTTGQGPLPAANAVMVKWATSVPSRSGRGRTYHSPIGTNAIGAGGNVDTATKTVFQNAGAALIDSFDGIADGALGVYSREDNVIRDFVGCSVLSKFAVLRSRRD